MKALFGPYNFPSLLESSVISVAQSNQDHIQAFLALNDSVTIGSEYDFDDVLHEINVILDDIKVLYCFHCYFYYLIVIYDLSYYF